MPRYFVIFFFLILLCSCSQEDHTPMEMEVDPIVPVVTDRYNPCEFDLADKEGTYDLLRTWEFISFQTISDGSFYNYKAELTCSARIAVIYKHQSSSENPFQLLLDLKDPAINPSCENYNWFELNAFMNTLKQCFYLNEDRKEIEFLFDEEADVVRIYQSGTFPELAFDELYIKSLQDVSKYEIEANKLYLYPKDSNERMVFIAFN